MDMDRDVEMLRGKTTRSKLILACIALDLCALATLRLHDFQPTDTPLFPLFSIYTHPIKLVFFIFMAISGAGPLANRSLFWIGYNRADVGIARAGTRRVIRRLILGRSLIRVSFPLFITYSSRLQSLVPTSS